MATLTYAGVPLQILQTVDFDIRADRTGDDTDYRLMAVFLHVRCVWNPAATASNVQGNGRGDRVGISLDNLRQTLLQPRQHLTYRVGSDTVLDLPLAGAPADAANGPKPEYCRVTSILGDRTAFVDFAVRCWVNDGDNVVLANRWGARHTLDQDYYTVIAYEGQADFRKDLLNLRDLDIDQFRHSLIPPPDFGFKRESLDVEMTEDGRQLRYRVMDRQAYLLLGEASPATRVEGNVTVGSDSPIRNLWDLLKKIKQGVEAAGSGIFDPLGALGKGVALLPSVLPTVRANAIVRVWGRLEARRSFLADMAVQVALDRLTPFGGVLGFGIGGVWPVSAYLTQDVSENFVEFRMECFTGAGQIVQANLQPLQFEHFMELDRNINVNGMGQLQYANNNPNGAMGPVPLNSNATRGSYLPTLLGQLLGVAGRPPVTPTSPVARPDRPLE